MKSDGRRLRVFHAADWGHSEARWRGAGEIGGGAGRGARKGRKCPLRQVARLIEEIAKEGGWTYAVKVPKFTPPPPTSKKNYFHDRPFYGTCGGRIFISVP